VVGDGDDVDQWWWRVVVAVVVVVGWLWDPLRFRALCELVVGCGIRARIPLNCRERGEVVTVVLALSGSWASWPYAVGELAL
jgi:hypothetical protein